MVVARIAVALLISIAAWACGHRRPSTDTHPSGPPAEINRATEHLAITGTFAFANESGSELLSLALSDSPQSYSSAVCREGHVPVRYVRTQSGRENSSHRQVANNFANEPGDVYQLSDSTVAADATCFVTTDAFRSRLTSVIRPLSGARCSDAQNADFVRLAGRSTLHCWRLAGLDDGSEFVAVQVAHVDTVALAAVAIIQDSVLLFHGLPGRYTGPGESIWRVDDGGVFDPDAIRLLFTTRPPYGLAAAFTWSGAEGESLQLVVADSAVVARNAVAAYRYWSPL